MSMQTQDPYLELLDTLEPPEPPQGYEDEYYALGEFQMPDYGPEDYPAQDYTPEDFSPRDPQHLRSRAMANIAQAYAAAHGHPLEHNLQPHQGVRWSVPLRTAVAGLAVVGVLAAGIIGVQNGRAAQQSPVTLLPEPSVADQQMENGTASTPPEPTPGVIFVHVAGQVANPQVVQIPSGSRVIDALTAAGGPLPGADLDAVNLARNLSDGEQIFLPLPGQLPPAGTAQASGGQTSAQSSQGNIRGKVNLNSASQTELEALPGIGPALAGRILEYRETHGSFTSIAQLKQVSGIGPKVFASLKDSITI